MPLFVGTRRSLLGRNYEREAQALFSRFTSPPADARKDLINRLIVDLKRIGVWENADLLYLTAAADSQAARQNWIADLYNATAVSSPTFTADRGYAGNGTTSYLDTNWAPSTQGVKFTLNAASLLLWSRTNALGSDVGSNQDSGTSATGSSINIKASNGTMIGRANAVSGSTFSLTGPTSSIGLGGWTRLNGSQVIPIFDGVDQTPISNTADAIGTGNMFIGRGATAFSTKEFAAAMIGAFTIAQIAAARVALNTYLTAIGAA